MKQYRNRWQRGQEIKEKVSLGDPFLIGVIVGFTMGEGSFNVCIKTSKTIKIGYQLEPMFKIKLKRKDSDILHRVQQLLGCGHIHCRDNEVEYRVTKFADLLEIIIPFFDRNPLLNIKQKDFIFFKLICYKILHGEGRTKEGFNKILTIRNLMNDGGHVNRRKIFL